MDHILSFVVASSRVQGANFNDCMYSERMEQREIDAALVVLESMFNMGRMRLLKKK